MSVQSAPQPGDGGGTGPSPLEEPLATLLHALVISQQLFVGYPILWDRAFLAFIPRSSETAVVLHAGPPPTPSAPPKLPPRPPPSPLAPPAVKQSGGTPMWIVPVGVLCGVVILALGCLNWKELSEALHEGQSQCGCLDLYCDCLGRCCAIVRKRRRVAPERQEGKTKQPTRTRNAEGRKGDTREDRSGSGSESPYGSDNESDQSGSLEGRRQSVSQRTPPSIRPPPVHTSPGLHMSSPATPGSRPGCKSPANRRSPYARGGGGTPSSPYPHRGPGQMLPVSYEPPVAVLRDAELVISTDGRAGYLLPPVKGPLQKGRSQRRLFTDAPPPEKASTAHRTLAPPNIGPAPWLGSACAQHPQHQPMSRSGMSDAGCSDSSCSSLATNPAPGARQRARGNVSLAAAPHSSPMPKIAEGNSKPRNNAPTTGGVTTTRSVSAAPAAAPVAPRIPEPEMQLASLVRDRVRDRRAARAKEEAPPPEAG